jgi:hypothetical protein
MDHTTVCLPVRVWWREEQLGPPVGHFPGENMSKFRTLVPALVGEGG